MKSSAELNRMLSGVFDRLSADEDSILTLASAPKLVANTGSRSAVAYERGDVEQHQAFRIRKTTNGHRLPPLSENSFEVRLERAREAEKHRRAQSESVQLISSSSRGTQLLPPVGPRVHVRRHKNSVPQSGDRRAEATSLLQSPLVRLSNAADATSLSQQQQVSCGSHGDSEALAAHRRQCGLCRELHDMYFDAQFSNLFVREHTHRQNIVMESILFREGPLSDEWAEIRGLRRAQERQQQSVSEQQKRFERQCDQLQQHVMRAYRSERLGVLTEWEIGFDEIAALEKLSLRHLNQLRDMRDKKTQRVSAEQETERVSLLQQQLERALQRAKIAQDAVIGDEVFQRDHIRQTESAVFGALELVFKDTKKKLSDAEAHVYNMLARHAQKLQNIENEKEKLKLEEIARRDLMHSTEKRAYEMMQLMEPESRRRASQQCAARLKRQSAERGALEATMEQALTELRAEEQEGFGNVLQQHTDDWGTLEQRRQRRLLKERRRDMRVAVEQKAREIMRAEDDCAWAWVRHRFANSLVYPCVDDEAKARSSLAQEKKVEKDFIWDLLRVRLYLNQTERRLRQEILDAEAAAFSVLYDTLRQANTLAAFLWFETVERRTIAAEWLDICNSSLSGLHQALVMCASVTAQFPKSKTDKVLTSSSSDVAFWPRNSLFVWYWLSDDVSLLEGASLRSASSTNTVLTDLKNLEVSVDLLTGDDGDEVLYKEPNNPNDPVPLLAKFRSGKPLSFAYTGPARDLFSAVKYRNIRPYSKYHAYPRVVRVTIDKTLVFVIHVVPVSPICPLPSVSVTSRMVYPMTLFNVPNWQDFKTCRLVLALNEANCGPHGGGHRLMLQVPAEFTMHAKNGLMHQGKVLMRPKQITEKLLELEFDPKTNAVMRPFLQTIAVQHGDDTAVLMPLQLDVFLQRKSDGSTLKISQKLDIDSESSDSPMLRVPSSDLYYRLAAVSVSDVLDPYLLANPQHVMSSCSIVFPPAQKDIRGGVVKVLLEGHDTVTTLGMHCTGSQRHFVIVSPQGTLLYNLDAAPYEQVDAADSSVSDCSGSQSSLVPSYGPTIVNSNEAESLKKSARYVPVAVVHGLDSVSLQLHFRDDVALTHAVVNHILRSITVQSSRRSISRKSNTGDVLTTMKLHLVVDMGLSSDAVESTFRLHVCVPVLECAAKAGGFPYREGAGPKVLPSLSMRPLSILPMHQQLSPEATITVSVVAGLEASDEIDVADCEVMNENSLVHVQNGQRIAEVHRVSASSVQLRLAGSFCGAPWLRRSIEDAYSLAATSHAVTNKYDVTPAHVNVLLRSIRYNCNSVDPQESKKVVVVTFDDGRTGRSTIGLDLAIETVDDPTDIVIDQPVVEFRQNSKKAIAGCPILPTVRLEDIDSDNFHGGYITVEHCSGPGEIGDHLYILTPKQQEQLLFRAVGKSTTTYLQHLLLASSALEAAGGCLALATIVDEQPVKLLSLRENRYMMLGGESIGQIVTKQTGTKEERVTYSIRMNFQSESKFVSFPAAEYCLRCFAFDNRSAKMNTLERQYQITLNCTGLKSTCDTVEKITVDGYLALLANPPFASSIKYEEGGKPKPILKQATTALHQQLFQKGYLKATILNPCDGDEIQLDPSCPDFKVKDGRTVVAGKENICTIPNRKALSSIHIDFLKVQNASLQSLVRALVFSASLRNIDPTQRLVEVECSTGNDVDLCSVTIAVDIQRRDEPAEFVVSADAAPIVYMSGQTPSALCPWMTPTLRKNLPPGTELEIALPEKPRLGEYLGLTSTSEVDVSEDEEMQRVHLTLCEKAYKLVAYAAKAKEIEGAAFLYGRTLSVTTVAEVTAEDLKRLIDTLCYANNCKTDRGTKKIISLTLKQRSTLLARTQVAVEIIAPILDFSGCNNVVHAMPGAPTPIAPGCRLQLSTILRSVEISVVVQAGYDFSDALVFKFPQNDTFGFQVTSDGIFITNAVLAQQLQQTILQQAAGPADLLSPLSSSSPLVANRRSLVNPNLFSKDGKSVYLAAVSTTTTSISISCEGTLSNSALQALLRCVALTGEPTGEKDILVEITVASLCGACRELVRVLM